MLVRIGTKLLALCSALECDSHRNTLTLVNDTRGLHVAELTRDALRNMGRYIAGARVLVAGASYREDVGDTRYSGSELVVRKLTEMGADISVHDPYVDHWYELENQDTYPAPGHSWSRLFRNQQDLSGVHVQKDLSAALRGVEALVLAVRHAPYLQLNPDDVVRWAGGPIPVIDCFGILQDDEIRRYFECTRCTRTRKTPSGVWSMAEQSAERRPVIWRFMQHLLSEADSC
jgi:UDP-N-acetyl-D-mannosaminuronate dehydrogenase